MRIECFHGFETTKHNVSDALHLIQSRSSGMVAMTIAAQSQRYNLNSPNIYFLDQAFSFVRKQIGKNRTGPPISSKKLRLYFPRRVGKVENSATQAHGAPKLQQSELCKPKTYSPQEHAKLPEGRPTSTVEGVLRTRSPIILAPLCWGNPHLVFCPQP